MYRPSGAGTTVPYQPGSCRRTEFILSTNRPDHLIVFLNRGRIIVSHDSDLCLLWCRFPSQGGPVINRRCWPYLRLHPFIPIALFIALNCFSSKFANLLECWVLYGYSSL